MARQLNHIQRGLSTDKSEFATPVASDALPIVPQTHTSLSTSRVFNLHKIDEQCSQVSPQHIGSIHLDGREITSLFNLYVQPLPSKTQFNRS